MIDTPSMAKYYVESKKNPWKIIENWRDEIK